jgi:hypothetical protein
MKKMRLRIVEDLVGCGSLPWYRLEREVKGLSEDRWSYVAGSTKISDLEVIVEMLLRTGTGVRVIKEFSNDPPDSVGPPADSLVAPQPKPA